MIRWGSAEEDNVRLLFNTQYPVLDESSLLGKGTLQDRCCEGAVAAGTLDEDDITHVLQRTSKAIQDIDALVTTAMHTSTQS